MAVAFVVADSVLAAKDAAEAVVVDVDSLPSVTDAEAEIGYYEGEGLLLEHTLREQVLLALPLRSICRDDCKGLCPQCGKNLNEVQCDCVDEVEDPRWSALKEIRDKLNQ